MRKKTKLPPRLRLPHLTNSQYEEVAAIARKSGIPLSQCPTCLTKEIEVDEDNHGWVNGTYRLDGVEHECDCYTQMMLRKHYLLANIGDQYQRLNWADFQGTKDAVDAVEMYLGSWQTAKINGMGLEFSSPALGVGKTFAATYVAKELVKKGESVYFTPFNNVVNLYSKEATYRDRTEQRLADTTVLVLDEVIPAISHAQNQLFASKFEDLIRHRTNFNRPTIMTTNMTPDALHEEYPRTYSLLEAKQIRIEMSGADARQGVRGMRNLELLANEEVEPIT